MSDNSSQGGVSGLFLLGVVFVALKLTHVIDWSWWWVTLPFWFGLAFVLGVILFWGLAMGFIRVYRSRRQK